MSKEDRVEKGYCNFDLIDHYRDFKDDWQKQEVRVNEIDGFKRTYPLPEGIRKINILI